MANSRRIKIEFRAQLIQILTHLYNDYAPSEKFSTYDNYDEFTFPADCTSFINLHAEIGELIECLRLQNKFSSYLLSNDDV